MDTLSDAQWKAFNEDGFVILGKVATDAELEALNQRIDDLMAGTVTYGEKLLMQLDPNATTPGSDRKAAAPTTPAAAAANEYDTYKAQGAEVSGQFGHIGFKGASLAYRKIGEAHAGLECDPLFAAFQSKPLFHDICRRMYGAHAAIAMYRSMVMCKPAGDLGGGSLLPFHQDGGDWWALDRDPLVFVWTALTASTRENGAVQVVRGSHKHGILSQRGHTLTPELVAAVCDAHPEDVIDLELAPGEAGEKW